VRARCAILDPVRANRLRHPAARLLAEYFWGYVAAIRRAPLSEADRRECYRHLAQWLLDRATSRVLPRRLMQTEDQGSALRGDLVVSVRAVVAGQETNLS
jgi:hypothetical protein